MHKSKSSDFRCFITSVLVPDRVGLLCDVTKAVFALEGNIGSIRQNVVDGHFNLVFNSEHPASVSPETLRSLLSGSLEAEAFVTVLDCPAGRKFSAPAGSRFVIMTRGPDKPGTIFAISSFMVEHNINIQEWMVEKEEVGKVVYIAQVIVPAAADFRLIQNSFRDEMAKLGLTALLCHENIFRATNEIVPIKSLIGQ